MSKVELGEIECDPLNLFLQGQTTVHLKKLSQMDPNFVLLSL